MIVKVEVVVDTNDAGDKQAIEEMIEILTQMREENNES